MQPRDPASTFWTGFYYWEWKWSHIMVAYKLISMPDLQVELKWNRKTASAHCKLVPQTGIKRQHDIPYPFSYYLRTKYTFVSNIESECVCNILRLSLFGFSLRLRNLYLPKFFNNLFQLLKMSFNIKKQQHKFSKICHHDWVNML